MKINDIKKISFREKLKKDVILIDGAFGTYAAAVGLKDTDFKDKPGCMEYLSIACPDLIRRIHTDYLEASSDAIETNTFGANSVKLSEYGLSERVYEINLESTRLARKAADKFSVYSFPRYVIGSMGPTGKLPSSSDPTLGDITYQELKKIFYEQALGIIDGGADALLVETGQDLLEMKAAVNGAKEAVKAKAKDILIMAQCTLANSGRMLLGTEISAVCGVMGYLGVDVVGLNCSSGPIEMEPAIKQLSKFASSYISVVPNAGLPIEKDGKAVYPLAPAEMARIIAGFVKKYKIDVVGGCCGSTPEHIRAIRKVLKDTGKRKIPKNVSYSSFYRGISLDESARPIKVGERINTQGSKKMKDLLRENNFDGIVELGKNQEKSGCNVLDVCVVLSERATEKKDMALLVKKLAESVNVPLMIDSTDIEVIRTALEVYPGTAFINSANMEDGGKRAKVIFALAKEHASFIVNLVIDEQGMAKTTAKKVEIAERLLKIAHGEYGIEKHRMIFDMLTFTLATGETEYSSSAKETLEAIKVFKREEKDALTALGVSNISFGLTKEARKILNMVFLHLASSRGLDAAIINPAEFIEYKDIPRKERKLAEDLILDRAPVPLAEFLKYFEAKGEELPKQKKAQEADALTSRERLRRCIIDRDKVNIIAAVDKALTEYPAEKIINEMIIEVMKEIGEKLGTGELVLPYVLQSAEVVRAAIEHLDKFLPKEAGKKKCKILLATVAGDVHDIGKNLVKMILENNGFSVIDLGKQVTIDRIIEEAKLNKVDAVGLSALLVSTARHMKTCVQTMHDAGLSYPVL
ncbi:MAG: homocysteine S-methyltransferase family protein, partial [Candidatus Omnitrophica bacterium]|nr:homocysteine S-methyltransferase family protein [Candidatus Omnitrophota bacterium]